MKLHRRAAVSLAVAAALITPVAGSVTTASAYTVLPAHVYAPYYETYLAPNTPGITATAQASGVKYFTLAFLQAPSKGSCALDWNGLASQPLNYYASDIASLRAMGGDVIPSFGGYSADHGGTEIADSCTNVQSIAADYALGPSTATRARASRRTRGTSVTYSNRSRADRAQSHDPFSFSAL
jgi:hypothetical protein